MERRDFPPKIEASRVGIEKAAIWTEGFESARRIIGKSGTIALATDKGLRGENEDALVLDVEHDAFAVVDGMGGYEHGEVAARIVADALAEDFKNPTADPLGAQTNAWKRMRAEGVRDGGAAYLACRVDRGGKELMIYQAGDAQLMVVDAKGVIKFKTTPTGLHDAPRGVSLGNPSTEGTELKNYDCIVASTDGLWDNVVPEQVARIVADCKVENALRQLEALAKRGMTQGMEFPHGHAHGNKDNLTIVLYKILPMPLRGK